MLYLGDMKNSNWGLVTTFLFFFILGFIVGDIIKSHGIAPITNDVLGYGEYTPTKNTSVMTIRWIRDETKIKDALLEYSKEYPLQEGMYYEGLAYWRGNRCTVYSFEPLDNYDTHAMMVLGHEMLHCFRGAFHN